MDGTSKQASPVMIEIDGRTIQAEEGMMIIQAASAAGIYIPHFCYHDKLSIAANCRMCLVEVEKARKPVPACATPVTDGMKVFTRSDVARNAQRGTMEFLLINHPLDCPICDQGGECELQDLAVGYGRDVSRFHEGKRIIKDKYIGPLIETEMTRCIYCMRCVRFGEEIAGVMELGAVGRGEDTRVGTFLDSTVDSEMSGNVIDLCPVGALTSKPYRYTARPWELVDHPSIAPHDAFGSNLNVQVRGHEVMRVLPRENNEINECWLSDRDRFSYEALGSDDRLLEPRVKRNGRWEDVTWEEALDFAARGIKRIIERDGAGRFGTLVSPTATLEEFYLAQKLTRGLGSGNVDHRLRQLDFADDDIAPLFPWFGQSIADIEKVDTALLVGCDLRKDIPMLAHRLRKAVLNGARVAAVNPVDFRVNYPLAENIVAGSADLMTALAGIARVLRDRTGRSVPAAAESWLQGAAPSEAGERIANLLLMGQASAVLVGPQAMNSTWAPAARALAELIAELSDAHLGLLPEANSVAGWLAGCLPHRGAAGAEALVGRNARTMLSDPLKAYLLFGVEPELDCGDGSRARTAMQAADFVVLVSAFKPDAEGTAAVDYADVMLPLAPFTETDGTFINGEGRVQPFTAAVRPRGNARPGWKILRMLGTVAGVDGMDYVSIDDVRTNIGFGDIPASSRLREWRIPETAAPTPGELQRILETPMYVSDPILRRARSLQATRDNPPPAARMNEVEAGKAGLQDGEQVVVRMVEGAAHLPLVIDSRVPDGCVLVPSGHPQTATLGASGPVTVVRA
jgi:NADH-quinone oxidoreductase subunit G